MTRALTVGVVLVMALGAGLRTTQFAAGTSLWHDELRLALNLENRSLLHLLSAPLDFLQIVPPAFLVVSWLAAQLPVAEEFGLRLLPWLSSLASLLLFWKVASGILSRAVAAAALAAFAVSPALVWYGGNAKPYAGDFAATLLLVWLALRFDHNPDNLAVVRFGGAAGALAVLFSFAAVPTAVVLTMLLGWRSRAAMYPPRSLLRLAGPWCAAGVLVFVWTSYTVEPSSREQLARYWAHAYPPAPWQSPSALAWVPGRLLTTLGHLLLFDPRQLGTAGLAVTVAFALVAGLGLLSMGARRRWQDAVALAPVAAAIGAAALRQFPFDGRVSIYAGWPLVVAAGTGINAVMAWTRSELRPAAAGLMATLTAAPAVLLLNGGIPPYHHQPARDVLAALKQRMLPGDRIFAYYGAVPAMKFYGPRVGLQRWTAGECHRDNSRAYLREIDSLRGVDRLWFVYTHAALGWKEPEAIRSYLSTIGIEQERISDPFGLSGEREAAAILYDLSDPERLSATSAETHILDQVPRGMRTLCDGTRLEATSVLSQPSIPLRSRR